MTPAPPLQLIVGAAGHGVVDYAADVAAALRAVDDRTRVIAVDDIAEAHAVAQAASRTHLHVTGQLLGGSPEEAADNVERLAAVTSLTITVHDVPQTSDGTALPRRVAAYTRFLAAARAAAVNSHHEQLLVAEFLPTAAAPHAIPLGARVAVTPARAGVAVAAPLHPRDLTVLIAGYVYPGKGHSEAIAAAAQAAAQLRQAGEPVGATVVRAIGGSSAGHEGDVRELAFQAERQGVRFEVTGFLDDAAFSRRIAEDGIPLAAHAHVSASRSMLDWVEAGRRPLVVASRYAQEMAALRPGTMALYESAELPRDLAAAWQASERTWLDAGTPLAPTLADAAEQYRAWWAALQ